MTPRTKAKNLRYNSIVCYAIFCLRTEAGARDVLITGSEKTTHYYFFWVWKAGLRTTGFTYELRLLASPPTISQLGSAKD
jgi:hypothetical protein